MTVSEAVYVMLETSQFEELVSMIGSVGVCVSRVEVGLWFMVLVVGYLLLRVVIRRDF